MNAETERTCKDCGKTRAIKDFYVRRGRYDISAGVERRFLVRQLSVRCRYCEKRRLLASTGAARERAIRYGKIPEVMLDAAAQGRERKRRAKIRDAVTRRWIRHHKAERVSYVRPELNRMRAALRNNGQVSAALSGFYLRYIAALKALMKVRPTKPLSQEEHLDPLFNAAREAWAALTPEERGLRTPPRRIVLPPRKTRGEAMTQTLQAWLDEQAPPT